MWCKMFVFVMIDIAFVRVYPFSHTLYILACSYQFFVLFQYVSPNGEISVKYDPRAYRSGTRNSIGSNKASNSIF